MGEDSLASEYVVPSELRQFFIVAKYAHGKADVKNLTAILTTEVGSSGPSYQVSGELCVSRPAKGSSYPKCASVTKHQTNFSAVENLTRRAGQWYVLLPKSLSKLYK
jgi:hypothetical protein